MGVGRDRMTRMTSRCPSVWQGAAVLAIAEGTLTADNRVPMRDVVTGVVTPPADRPLVFKSVGMSWQGLVVAEAVIPSGLLPDAWPWIAATGLGDGFDRARRQW
jgi:hypothetical protein